VAPYTAVFYRGPQFWGLQGTGTRELGL
jgi:hypothetical protein